MRETNGGVVQRNPFGWQLEQISSHDYRSKHKLSQLTLDINGHLINITEGPKLLGVTVDKDLHLSEHISTICEQASRLIGVLMRLRKLIPTEAKLHKVPS